MFRLQAGCWARPPRFWPTVETAIGRVARSEPAAAAATRRTGVSAAAAAAAASAAAATGHARSIHTCRRRARIPGAVTVGVAGLLRPAVADRRRAFATTTTATPNLPDLDKVVALVDGACNRLLTHPAIPSEQETATALQICAEAADLIMDAAVQPQLSSIDHQADTAASTLLTLDRGRKSTAAAATGAAAAAATNAGSSSASSSAGAAVSSPSSSNQPARLRSVVAHISDAAYAIVDEPRVHLTPRLLEQYVHIQARLGRPESLPHVLRLYASKPVARPGSGSALGSTPNVRFTPQNSGLPSHAVASAVAEAALDAALAAKNLDAAVGVVEYTYAAPAFVRAKLLRKGLLPAFVVVGVPLATYLLAQQLAAYQNTMEPQTATGVAFAAILAYIGFTGMLGFVANASANDQMRRVTWAQGTALSERWLREDERAALDKVACAFGFSETDRFGEEEGSEFHALREYIMRKGMLLDAVELMEGMSS